MDLIDGVIKSYDWGSHTALAELAGRPSPSDHPEAELWFGAHESAPSPLAGDSESATLEALIAADPVSELGAECSKAFSGRLPFLLKVLAAQRPLSLQAHPTQEQARAGFSRENSAGIPIDAAHRNYRDDRHKPELVVALEQFDVLAGFRDISKTVGFLTAVNVSYVAADVAALAASPTPTQLAQTVSRWLRMPRMGCEQATDELVGRISALLASGGRVVDRYGAELSTTLDVARRYRGDRGVLVSMLLNRVTLAPGEGMYLPAGNLHAYLRGTAVEIMANSDNVLRGGLTTKYVDIDELSAVLDFDPISPDVLRPEPSGREYVYPTPAREFALRRWELDSAETVISTNRGPTMILCTSGRVSVRCGSNEASVGAGQTLWMPAGAGAVSVESVTPSARLFIASVPV